MSNEFITENEFSLEKEITTMNFDQMINANAKPKAKKSATKKSAEIIPVPADVQVEIDKLLSAKQNKKVAESEIKKAEPKIIDFGISLKDENAYKGNFQKSYKLGNDDKHVNLVTANKWSFNEEDVVLIKETIEDAGGDVDEMLIEETEVRLKSDVFKDEDLKKRFVEMVGAEFPEFFETVKSHHVSEDFDEKIYKLGKDAVDNLMVYMKQSKPSLR